ncbi:MAG TPA: hypothetical protein VI998_04060 [Patescibacteria group bacterium]|nr:hypothetical protein [Patescibacteria group bacterium]
MTLQTFQLIWKTAKELVSEIFKISLLSYLVFYLIEDFFPGFVSGFFNMNILLGIVVGSGVFTVISQKEESKEGEGKEVKNKIRARDIVFIVILSIIAGGLIYLKTKDLGKLGLAISIISGIIILLMSILLLTEEEPFDSAQGKK